MDASPVKRLYKYYGLLAEAAEDGEKILEHEDLFKNIINARHGNSEEKRLAAQFIPKFSQYFPHLQNSCISSQLDLCEDADLVVRKQAVKEVTSLCRLNPSCIKRVAYFISQLLGAEDVGEGLLVRNTLVSLFNIEPAATLGGIFAQIHDGNPKMQERCKTFLFNKFGSLNKTVLSKLRETLLKELETALENCNSEEIRTVVPLIPFVAEDESEVDQISVGIYERQLNLEKQFLTSDEEDLERVSELVRFAKTHFTKGVDSGKFVSIYIQTVLPLLKDVEGYGTGTGRAAFVLKQLAEIDNFCSELPEPDVCYRILFDVLNELLPTEVESEETKKYTVNFTMVECLLAVVLSLMRKSPPNFEGFDTKLEDLRTKLRFFIRLVEAYRRRVADLDKDVIDHHLQSTSLRSFDNLKVLVKSLFFDPPKPTSVSLSCCKTGPVAKKRRSSSSASEQQKKIDPHKLRVQQIYTPPGGKYSRSFKRF